MRMNLKKVLIVLILSCSLCFTACDNLPENVGNLAESNNEVSNGGSTDFGSVSNQSGQGISSQEIINSVIEVASVIDAEASKTDIVSGFEITKVGETSEFRKEGNTYIITTIIRFT